MIILPSFPVVYGQHLPDVLTWSVEPGPSTEPLKKRPRRLTPRRENSPPLKTAEALFCPGIVRSIATYTKFPIYTHYVPEIHVNVKEDRPLHKNNVLKWR